ncbi:MAG TPA: hypothetical protein VJL86_10990 [Steroidobacteraceae bacterium]|nr:hypothetical protein [Steroidobacteraceae bacterium]
MSNDLYFAIAVLLCGVVASRFIAENALKLLTTEKKAELLDAFSTQRKFGLLIVVALIVITLRRPFAMAMALSAYFVVSQIWAYTQIRKLQLPASYVKRFFMAAAVLCAAIAAFVTLQFWLR